MILGIIYRLVKIFGRRPSSRDFLAYFWFVAFLEFGHVGHKGLTRSFFQSGWHFPENPKIDGDTDPFLKSSKILNHYAAPARICIFKK